MHEPNRIATEAPCARAMRTLEVEPRLAPYELGLFTLTRHLRNPLVAAFWSLLDGPSA